MTVAEIQARTGVAAAEGNRPRSDAGIEDAQLLFFQDLGRGDMNTNLDAGLESSDLPDALEEGKRAALEKFGDGCAVGEGVAEARFAEVRDFESEAAQRGQKLVWRNVVCVDIRVGEDAALEGLEIDGLGVGDGSDQDACEAHRGCVVDCAQRQGKDEAHEEDLGRRRGGGEEGKGGFAEAGHFWMYNQQPITFAIGHDFDVLPRDPGAQRPTEWSQNELNIGEVDELWLQEWGLMAQIGKSDCKGRRRRAPRNGRSSGMLPYSSIRRDQTRRQEVAVAEFETKIQDGQTEHSEMVKLEIAPLKSPPPST
ncbi:hypothetical protein DFH09DRAFT_1094904 [Mycena vulgaris]|nr:hypothetical protein DFH09DRAFT_1094904 [Mycena vulgaris]